jgi:hypothetical protein
MDFVMISLREPMPIYSEPWKQAPKDIGYNWNLGPQYENAADVFEKYLALYQEARVTRDDVLRRLHEIHPQYRHWIIDRNSYAIRDILGSPSEWMPSLVEKMPREQILDLIGWSDYSTLEKIEKAIASAPKGAFRDALAEQSLDMMLDKQAPLDKVLKKAREWDGNLDWTRIYHSWTEQSPEDAVNHLLKRTNATADEWDAVISRAYDSHAKVLENAVEKMPQGPIRDTSLSALSYSAMDEDKGATTAIYWATQVKNSSDRYDLFQKIFLSLEHDKTAAKNPQIIEGIKLNIERSALNAKEKAIWFDRLECEVLK